MASKSVMKPEPVDKRKYSALLVTDSNDPSTTNTKDSSAVNSVIREPRRTRQSVRKGTVHDGAQKSSEFEERKADDPDTRGRKRVRREETKHVAKYGVVDLTTEDDLDETWATMHRELSTGPHAKKLKLSLDAWREKELRKLEIDLEPKWYAPNEFFSRPARKHKKRNQTTEPSHGQVSHPAIREIEENPYRRSERNMQKHIAESTRPSRIAKPKKQKKVASTVGKKLDMQTIQKGIARGQAQIVGGAKQEVEDDTDDAVEESKSLLKKAKQKLPQNQQNEEGKATIAPRSFKRPGAGARKEINARAARCETHLPTASSRAATDGPLSTNPDRNEASGRSLTLSIRSRTPAFDR